MTRRARWGLVAVLSGLVLLAVVPFVIERALFARRVEAAERLAPGSTEAEVREALGDPTHARRSLFTLGKLQWEYEAPDEAAWFVPFDLGWDLPKTRSLLVDFDAEGRLRTVTPPRE